MRPLIMLLAAFELLAMGGFMPRTASGTKEIDWAAVEQTISSAKSSSELNLQLRQFYARAQSKQATANDLYGFSTAEYYCITTAAQGVTRGEAENPPINEYVRVAHRLVDQCPSDASAYISLARFVYYNGDTDIHEKVSGKKWITGTVNGKQVPILVVSEDGTETRKRVTELIEKARKLNPDHPLVLAYFSGRAIKDDPVKALHLASLELKNAKGIVRLDALKRMALATEKLGRKEEAESYRKQFDAEAHKYGASLLVKLLRREGTFLVY